MSLAGKYRISQCCLFPHFEKRILTNERKAAGGDMGRDGAGCGVEASLLVKLLWLLSLVSSDRPERLPSPALPSPPCLPSPSAASGPGAPRLSLLPLTP